MYIHHIDPVAFTVFGWPVYWYGLAYVVGFLFCRLWVPRCYDNARGRGQPRVRGVKKNHQSSSYNIPALTARDWDDFLFYGMVATVVGGRLGFIIIYHAGEFFTLPLGQWWRWLAVWEGGMAFHGAAVGLWLASLWFCRKRGISLLFFFDQFARAIPVALLVGRLANFVNGELVGRPVVDPWWQQHIGVIFPWLDLLPRHPSQLYEAAGEGLLLFILLQLLAMGKDRGKDRAKDGGKDIKKDMVKDRLADVSIARTHQDHGRRGRNQLGYYFPDGVISAGFLFFYGFIRFMVEFFRLPQDGYIGPMTAGQWWCLVMILAGIMLYGWRLRALKK